MILQKLGLWLEAAELIWASLVGYYALPQPDKKGIGSSLGILANTLVSMNDEDFNTFKNNPDIDLSLLGDSSHRLLSAAQAAKMAVIYSQYTSLYVLTHVTTQGTCLLSYSFSVQCPPSQRQSYIQKAKESFEIGLLTKAEDEQVSSKQELHTFVKAAYSLTVTHKWLGTPREVVMQATEACQKALATFYRYCQADTKEKDGLCVEIMHLVSQVKLLFQLEPFLNTDKGSFIPDSYRNITDTAVSFTLEDFTKVMQKFKKYHASLCETTNSSCKGKGDKIDGVRLCITALGTTVPNTECTTEACSVSEDASKRGGANLSAVHLPPESDLGTTQESTDELGSSWQKFSLSGSGSPRSSNNGCIESLAMKAHTQSCLTTDVDDEAVHKSVEKNRKQELQNSTSGVGSHTFPIPVTSSNIRSHFKKSELMQADIQTLETEDVMADIDGVPPKPPSVGEGAVQSLSQLTLRTSSSSLGDSFGSQSSWEKISLDLNSPTSRKLQPHSQSKIPESHESIFHLETLETENSDSDSALGLKHKTCTSGVESEALSKPRSLRSRYVDQDMDTQVDCEPFEPVSNNSFQKHPQRAPCTSTEASTESSFEILDENHSRHQSSEENVNVPLSKNLSCYMCLKQSSSSIDPERQYVLSQQDYQALLAGVCYGCLLKRLQSDKTRFQLKNHNTAYCALHLKFSKATGLWTARETCIYIGESMMMEGQQRTAIWVQFLHQEERLSSYVGKDYKKPKQIQFHLKDVERQMTAQYYVTEFNKSLYDKEVMAQIFFIPSEAILILDGNEVVGCVTVEPYMLGDFVKLTNNTRKKDKRFKATEYGLAFGHFTYLFSGCQEVVVDLQGWVTANGKGLTYLTDPQIHSTKTPKGPSNFAASGLRCFLEEQHGPECNDICQLLKLPTVVGQPLILT
ncbi:alpha-protein kinase 1 [Xyrichtys novacula]|nr:alpha-protein kinase 1 [Xyrichtys novacula]